MSDMISELSPIFGSTKPYKSPLIMCSPDKDFSVSGRNKDKKERIAEAIRDLRLVIDGLQMQDGKLDSTSLPQAMSAVARTSSIFLRKLVLGDRDKRESRLLDNAVMKLLSLRLQPLRRIPSDRRRTIETGFSVSDGFVQFTKIDEPGPILPTQRLSFKAQSLRFSIVWPLPGMTDWVDQPTDAKPWLISPEQLFQITSSRSMNCNDWLDQKVLIFDSTPVALKHIIRNVANFEGAHAINVGTENNPIQNSKKKQKQVPIHLLNSIFLFGIPLPHIIVIETALYIYEQLLKESSSIGLQADEFSSVRPGLSCTPEQARSSHPEWLGFEGGMTLAFSSEPKSAQFTIRPVG